MKRFAALFVIMAIVLCVGICIAAESQHLSTKQKMVDSDSDGKIDSVDIYDDSGNVVKRGFDNDGDKWVDSWETYDENTGLPIVTQSDAAFLLQ